ncbi:MAG: RagB/SusD family nutrient uptake outer membrane protein, partial [Gloeobacteraceae cyanobacterium ES-bin-316]|nr:RagB/SusD family nutrient uptake outer membrane protein [Ferruginibacter sp.]
GLAAVAVGLQRVYTLGRGSTLYNLVNINGLTTNELIVVNPGNTAEVQLAAGGTSVDGNNSMLTQYWSTCNKVIYDADLILANANNLADKNYASGLIAYASIFKAMSLGAMAQFWEKIPAGIGTNVSFIDRVDGFKKAILVIDDAIAATSANAISATFISNMPAGINIVNTLYALKARYSLYANLYPQALAAANLVDLTKRSTFNFDALTLNPIFETATSTNNVVQPKDSTLGLIPALAPALTDGRVGFYTSINAQAAPRFRINGFANAAAAAFPIYLPGEITLIKAECYARTDDSTSSKTFLNQVITKTAASDVFGLGANLPPINSFGSYAALLDEIYKQRCIELFMSGQKLEDMRRFARPTSERKRNLMPYPVRERDNNPNTPANPPF